MGSIPITSTALMASKQSLTPVFLHWGLLFSKSILMDNQGRRPDQQETNETIAFIALVGLVITVLLVIIFSL